MSSRNKTDQNDSLFVSPEEYFNKLVEEGIAQRRLKTIPQTKTYLVRMLQHYLDTKNLFETEYDESGNRRPQTLAEMYLVASNAETISVRVELLKKLGDRALYISGFFGDSLDRKMVDIEYYANMGGVAYSTLANIVKEDTLSRIYSIFSKQFIEFVDVLTLISQKSMIQNNQSILRLYDRYLKTGSEMAREKLVEMGVLTLPIESSKVSRQ